MKNEASDTTMLAVTVIALAVVVAIGFGIFMYARSSLNTGSDKLNTALDSVNSSDFADYDQKSISGTRVLSAIQNFEGTPVAILIRTKALDKAAGDVVAEKTTNAKNRYYVGIVKTPTATGISDCDADAYINYNAILGNALSNAYATSTAATKDSNTTLDKLLTETIEGTYVADAKANSAANAAATDVKSKLEASPFIRLEDGVYIADYGFYSVNGVVQYYTEKSDYQTTGMTEFISSSTKFQANLIKDNSGTILGIVFEQIN